MNVIYCGQQGKILFIYLFLGQNRNYIILTNNMDLFDIMIKYQIL